jgi:peptide/nickel transport system permease protein
VWLPLVVLVSIVVLTIFAPVIAPADPMQTEAAIQLQPPGREHWLGTDLLGRDVLSRVLYGGQRTLFVAALATILAIIPGSLVGLIAGMIGGKLDSTIMMVLNAMLAFPGLMLALVVLTVMGGGVLSLAVATGFAQIAPFARITRSAVIAIKGMGYVEAAEAAGANRLYIARSHILPNVQAILLAYTGVVFSYSILNGAALSFLGLGGEPGVPDWGVILAEGRTAFRAAPWIGLAPGLAITLTVWAVNRLSDKLPHATMSVRL